MSKFVLPLLVGLLWACEDCVFTSKNTRLLVLAFYDAQSKEALDMSFDSAKTGFGEHIVRTPNNRKLEGKVFQLLMNPSADTSTFYFYRNRRADTLIVRIRRKVALITPDCGRDEKLDQLSVEYCTFPMDSLAVPKTELSLGSQNNVEIYLK